MGEYNEAYKMLEKSIEINSEFYKSLFNMGVVYKRLEDKNKALKYYYKALEYNKEYHYIYLNISAIYIEEKEYNKSIDILTEGIGNNLTKEDLYYNKACCYSLLGFEEKAVKDIRKSIVLNPSIKQYVEKDKDFYNLYNNKEFKKIIK